MLNRGDHMGMLDCIYQFFISKTYTQYRVWQKHFDKLARTTFKKNFFYLIKKILCNFYYPKPIFTRPSRGLRLVVFGIDLFIQKSHFCHTCKPSHFVPESPAQMTKFRKSPACRSAPAREYRISRIRIF